MREKEDKKRNRGYDGKRMRRERQEEEKCE